MRVVKTIDLWTEQNENHYECFNGAFVDGFENCGRGIPFDSLKIAKNCNCKISCDKENINISNKHNAIVFYKKSVPMRLLVINQKTDISKCVDVALNQLFEGEPLLKLFKKKKIVMTCVDLQEKAIFNEADKTKEIDVGSCDRWALLYNMLKGSYTESQSNYGNYGSCKYEFIPKVSVEYKLETNEEVFDIKHSCAFINDIKTRLIPIQDCSKLTVKS